MLVPSSTPTACTLVLNTFPVKVTEGLVADYIGVGSKFEV